MLGVLMFVFVAGFSMHEGVQGLVREHKELSSTEKTVETVFPPFETKTDAAPESWKDRRASGDRVREVHMIKDTNE